MDRVDYQSLVVQDLINLEKKGELDTNPWYQRRSVWTNSQKSYLINTIFQKKPIPSLYIRHSLNLDKGISIKEVVDGQQRCRAFIGYYNDEFASRHPEHEKPLKYSGLSKMQKQSYLLTSIPIGYLLGATDADVIDIFARINSVAKTLNSQEKRNAQFSGEFKQFCVTQAVKRTQFWKDYKIFSGNDIARMVEVQFISDVTMNFINGLSDFSDAKLTKFYKENDEDFPKAKELAKRLDEIFNMLVSLNPAVIKETIFSRQPLFFSLLEVLYRIKKFDKPKIEKGLTKIDALFNSDLPLASRAKQDINFYNASSSTTQRLNNRKVRKEYIQKFIV
jgi:hypothetical protein